MFPFGKKKSKPSIQRVNRSSFFFKLGSIFHRKTLPSPKRSLVQRPTLSPSKRKLSFIKRINPKIIRILIFALFFFIFSIIVFLTVSLFRNSNYSISEIIVIGNNSISVERFENEIKEFKGQSIFLVSPNKIRSKLQNAFPNLFSIEVKKIFPNKVFIKITETEPKLIVINLNGAYLLDENSKIIDILAQEQINYDGEKLEIVIGVADENSHLIKDAFIKKFLTDNKYESLTTAQQQEKISKEFNFDSISREDKLKEFKLLKDEILNEIDVLTGKILSKISINDYSFLTQIIFLDNTHYQKNDIIDKSRLELTLALVKYFADVNQESHIIGHIEWQGKMLVSAKLNNGTKVIFGALKKPSVQLEDYEIMVNYLREQNKNYSQIDLSSGKISVK
jgi:cell division septal protein FtsQ